VESLDSGTMNREDLVQYWKFCSRLISKYIISNKIGPALIFFFQKKGGTKLSTLCPLSRIQSSHFFSELSTQGQNEGFDMFPETLKMWLSLIKLVIED